MLGRLDIKDVIYHGDARAVETWLREGDVEEVRGYGEVRKVFVRAKLATSIVTA